MATSAQIDANRQNAEHSTGPQSPERKQAASQNAFKHGLRSASPVARGEDPAAWLAFAQEIIAECNPVGIAQRLLAERIAFLQWKLLRVPEIEVMQMNGVRNQLRDRGRRQAVDVPLYPPAGMLIAADLDTMVKLQAYEMRLQRALESAQRELRQLKQAAEAGERKRAEEIPPPSAKPATAIAPAPVATAVPESNPLPQPELQPNWVRSAGSTTTPPPMTSEIALREQR
jgi:hypothetical protein